MTHFSSRLTPLRLAFTRLRPRGMSSTSEELIAKALRHGRWSCVLRLGLGGARCHADCVRSVSWAMDAGRSYQLVATASRDQTVKLWALRRTSVAEEDDAAGAGPEGGGGAGAGGAASPPADALGDGWSARCCAELPHRSQVRRVSWNVDEL